MDFLQPFLRYIRILLILPLSLEINPNTELPFPFASVLFMFKKRDFDINDGSELGFKKEVAFQVGPACCIGDHVIQIAACLISSLPNRKSAAAYKF